MKHPLSTLLQRAFYLLPATFLLCSCVDSSVDYDDVDMKVKLNVDGLKVKFGDTEKIKLVDLLKPEGNIKNDADGLYYLVETGKTKLDFTIQKASSEIDANLLNVGYNFGDDIWKELLKQLTDAQKALLPKTGYDVPVNTNPDYSSFEDAKDFNFNLSWSNDVKQVNSIGLENATFNLKLKLQDDVAKNFAIYGLKNIKVTLPAYIKSNSAHYKDGVYTVPNRKIAEGQREVDLGNIVVDKLSFAKPLTTHKVPLEKFSLKGDLAMGVKTAFHMPGDKAPKATIALVVTINGKNKDVVKAKTVTGIFSPSIAPKVDPIKMKDQVPDFLQGDDVALKVDRMTLRFDADMTNIPASVVLKKGKLTSQAAGKNTEVQLAPEGVHLEKAKKNVVYFYQGNQPYDNETAASDAKKSVVKDFGKLIEKIPDVVNIRLADGAIQLTGEESTLEFGKKYSAQSSYKMLVPFAFSQGLKIDYTDETRDIEMDMEEVTSNNLSIGVTADALTNIPLTMKVKLIPLDEKGRVIAGIVVSEVDIKGSADGNLVTRPIKLTLKADNPKSLQLIKRFKFSVKASAEEVSTAKTLRSDQYLQIQNAKLTLGGSITADFN